MMVESRGCGRVSEIEIGVTLAQGLGIMALMALSFGSIERLSWPRSLRSVLTGMVFGAGAIVAMLSPATIAPGVIIDARQIMLGVAAAFGGVPAAIVSATIACLYRISIGGVGTNAALFAIWIASAMGLLWAGAIKPRDCLRRYGC
ncbi:hypothetical protein AJ87_19935 [Rhizobium yanglingense]|nr:hypothetical protein AJ87_19935 [Rhizobium yanglingense]